MPPVGLDRRFGRLDADPKGAVHERDREGGLPPRLGPSEATVRCASCREEVRADGTFYSEMGEICEVCYRA